MQRRTFIKGAGIAAAGLGMPAWMPQALASDGALSARHVTIGSTLAMTGMLGGAGKHHTAGIQAAFAWANKTGGVHGREIKLLTMDDAYVPQRTVDNVQQMVEGNEAFALMSIFGTGNIGRFLPYTEKVGVPFVGPITGASSLRNAQQRWTFHVRPGYAEEVSHLLTLMSNVGIRDIAIVYLDNGFGHEVLKDVQGRFERLNLRPVGAYKLAVNGENGEELAEQVMAAKAGGIFMATTGAATTSFVVPMRTRMPALAIAGVSVSVIPSEYAKLGGAIKGIAVARVFPGAEQIKYSLVRQFHEQMNHFGIKEPSSDSLESWVNAQIVIEGLRRAGRDLTRDKLRLALTSMRRIELGDYNLGFPEKAPYIASDRVDIAVYGPGARIVS